MGGLWSFGIGVTFIDILRLFVQYTFSLAKSSGKGILNIGMNGTQFVIYLLILASMVYVNRIGKLNLSN